MKWVSRLVAVLLGVFLLSITLHMFFPALRGGEAWVAYVQGLESSRPAGITLCLLTFIGIVSWIVSARSGSSHPRYLSYETEHGSISISLKALQDFLSNLKEEHSSILALNPKVTAREEGLTILLEVDVRSGESVPELSRKLQSRVRKLMEEKVGVSEIKSIEIRIEEIVNEKLPVNRELEPVPPPAGEVP